MVQKKSCLNKLDLGLNYIFFPNYTEMGALESVEYLKKIDNDMSEQQDIMEKEILYCLQFRVLLKLVRIV